MTPMPEDFARVRAAAEIKRLKRLMYRRARQARFSEAADARDRMGELRRELEHETD